MKREKEREIERGGGSGETDFTLSFILINFNGRRGKGLFSVALKCRYKLYEEVILAASCQKVLVPHHLEITVPVGWALNINN